MMLVDAAGYTVSQPWSWQSWENAGTGVQPPRNEGQAARAAAGPPEGWPSLAPIVSGTTSVGSMKTVRPAGPGLPQPLHGPAVGHRGHG